MCFFIVTDNFWDVVRCNRIYFDVMRLWRCVLIWFLCGSSFRFLRHALCLFLFGQYTLFGWLSSFSFDAYNNNNNPSDLVSDWLGTAQHSTAQQSTGQNFIDVQMSHILVIIIISISSAKVREGRKSRHEFLRYYSVNTAWQGVQHHIFGWCSIEIRRFA